MATNYKPVTGFGTIGKGSLQTKEQAQKKAVKRIDQKRKRKAYAYERSKEDVMYGTPGQGFEVIKGKEYPTLKDGKKATVDNMSISWIKENMKKKPLTKKATGGVAKKTPSKKSKPKNWIQEMKANEKQIRQEEDYGTSSLFYDAFLRKADNATKRVARNLWYKYDDARTATGKVSNFVKDVSKKIKASDGKKPVKKDVVATAKKQATKSYNAVKNYVPSTAKKVTKK
jgi:hypothetical protein